MFAKYKIPVKSSSVVVGVGWGSVDDVVVLRGWIRGISGAVVLGGRWRWVVVWRRLAGVRWGHGRLGSAICTCKRTWHVHNPVPIMYLFKKRSKREEFIYSILKKKCTHFNFIVGGWGSNKWKTVLCAYIVIYPKQLWITPQENHKVTYCMAELMRNLCRWCYWTRPLRVEPLDLWPLLFCIYRQRCRRRRWFRWWQRGQTVPL